MRDDDDRGLGFAPYALQGFAEARFRFGIEIRCGLVEQQYRRLAHQSTGKVADGFSTMLQTSVGATSSFAGGEMDTSRNDTTQVETISIFNPFANLLTTFTYTIKFRFSDGTVIDGPSNSIAANGRADVVVGNISAVRAKAGSAPEFRNYAITVTGPGVNGSSVTAASGLVQFTRVDTMTGRSITALGLSSVPGRLLSDPIFGTTGGNPGG